ncbi:MAG: TetR/AcrR family transcriptional regulator [Clostridia bacterium]|nr:TetR/AcrR family transcriptional regulator [Clostridia bacterium]
MALSKSERTKIQIMHAAKCLFEKTGIENVTFADIANEAGVCRTTVFNHFSCVKDLLFAIFMQEMEDLETFCNQSDYEGIPLIRGLFNRLIVDVANYPALSIRLANNAILSDAEVNPIAIVEGLVKNCLLKEKIDDAQALSAIITGAYFGLVNHYMIRKKDFNVEDMQKDFTNMLKHILGGNYYE